MLPRVLLLLSLLPSVAAADSKVPRVVARQGAAMLCWDRGKVIPAAFPAEEGDGRANATASPSVRVVSLVPLEPGPHGERGEADSLQPSTVQVTTHPGHAQLERCSLLLETPEQRQPEGSERKLTILPPATEPYRSLVRAGLKVQSASLRFLARIDLDGDGTEEVVFAGSYPARPSAATARWHREVAGTAPAWSTVSFVGVRFAVPKGERDLKVLATLEDSPAAYGIPGVSADGVTDVDGDGRLELVVSLRGDHWARHDFVGFRGSRPMQPITAELAW